MPKKVKQPFPAGFYKKYQQVAWSDKSCDKESSNDIAILRAASTFYGQGK
jgi:hypothetical protein